MKNTQLKCVIAATAVLFSASAMAADFGISKGTDLKSPSLDLAVNDSASPNSNTSTSQGSTTTPGSTTNQGSTTSPGSTTNPDSTTTDGKPKSKTGKALKRDQQREREMRRDNESDSGIRSGTSPRPSPYPSGTDLNPPADSGAPGQPRLDR